MAAQEAVKNYNFSTVSRCNGLDLSICEVQTAHLSSGYCHGGKHDK